MQSVFSEMLSFSVTIKPDIERAIHTFTSGGGETDSVHVFIDALYEDVTYKASFEDSKNISLGMTILVLKFPEWLPNVDYESTYETFTTKLGELGLQVEGASMRDVKTYFNLDKASLVREAIKKLDSICDIAKNLLEKKAGE